MIKAFGKKGDGRDRAFFIIALNPPVIFIAEKLKMTRIISICVFLIFASPTFGQVDAGLDTIYKLPFVEIIHNREPGFNPGLSTETLNANSSSNSQFSLGELMSRSSAAFIKQYGYGNLASPSLRGTASAHTALVWNGINLQSSMNGQTDLSLIPAALFDEFIVQEGAGSASWGSGAIGGAVFLNSSANHENSISFSQTSGSWGFSQQTLDANYQIKGIKLRSRVFSSSAINNYKYVDTAQPDEPVRHQTNSALEFMGFLQDIQFNTGAHSIFKATVWGQKSLRHIPPILTVPHSVANQSDRSLRATANWILYGNRSTLSIKAAVLREDIEYNDSLFAIHSMNSATSYIAEAVWTYRLTEKHQFELGHLYTYNVAKAHGYGNGLKEQNRPAFFTSLKSKWGKNETLNSLLTVRQEIFDGELLPVTPSISLSQQLLKNTKLRAQIARTFRVPTLNDLYWLQGGNPNLKPENGVAFELGLNSTLYSGNTFQFQAEISAFSTQVENWILWVPTGSFWSPHNVHTVQSNGVDIHLDANLKVSRKQSFNYTSNVQFVNSTIKENPTYIESIGKQLIYVPHFTATNNFIARFNSLSFNLQHSYTGLTYVNTNNSEGLPAFNLFHLSVSKDLDFEQNQASVFFQINNIGNTNYQVVLRRPMPLRTWMAGVNFQFKS